MRLAIRYDLMHFFQHRFNLKYHIDFILYAGFPQFYTEDTI